MASESQIVLVLRGDRPCAGVAEQSKEKDLIVVVPDGKRLTIPRGAVLARGPSAGEGQAREIAKQWEKRISEAASAVSLHELWELSEDGGETTAEELASGWLGAGATFESRAALLYALWNDRVYFERRKDRLSPEPRDRVDARLARIHDGERKSARVSALAAASAAIFASSRQSPAPHAALQPVVPLPPAGVEPGEWERFVAGLRELAVIGPDARGTAEAAEVLREAGLNVAEAPFDLLVAAGELASDENLDLLRHGVRSEFPAKVCTEAEQVVSAMQSVSWRTGREDATDIGAVTIDSASTVEVDDALSIREMGGCWEVGIHIADVASLLPEGGAIETEAVSRGATVYTPDAKFPMMPEALGAGCFSLDEGIDRPALSLLARLDREGQVREHRFARTVLRVARRLDYERADSLANEADPAIRDLVLLGEALKARRLAQGAAGFELPELEVRVEPDGTIHVSVTRGSTPSHVLVSECAILYNTLAARRLRDASLSCLFRTQPRPAQPLPDTRAGGYPAEFEVRRLLTPTSTSLDPGPHSTLGADCYTFATSPIRRAIDLLVQRQLACSLGDPTANGSAPSLPLPRTRAQLEKALLSFGPAMAAASEIERNRKRYFLLKYLDSHVRGYAVRGVVIEKLSDRILVHLPDYALDAPLRTRDPGSFVRGQDLAIRIDRADPRRDLLRLSLG